MISTTIESDIEVLIIQFMDGSVSVIQDGVVTATGAFPDVTLPGPFGFAKSSDSFVTTDTNFHLSSYR